MKKNESIDERIIEHSMVFNELKLNLKRIIVGQENLIDKIFIALLCNGHVLIEGVPGLAKTLTIKSLAKLLDSNYKRIQFTPDLLPADLIGTLIYNIKEAKFEVKKGPIFSNIILADEINRSPAKVQSSLLEAMQERQVTIGNETYDMDSPFLVMATQNPIEQEGTYPLPEAQVDRFMFKIIVDYPNEVEELEILKRFTNGKENLFSEKVIKIKDIMKSQKIINDIYIAENIEKYIVKIIASTRKPEDYGIKDISSLISFGASPRATIYLTYASKARAFFENRSYVTPQDIRYVINDILRHRLILSYEAEAEEISSQDIINRIIESIPTP